MTIVDLYEIMASSKSEVREKVVKAFLKESCGSQSETTHYEYNVEKYEDYKIVLKRPGVFKKGFDFTVNTRGLFYKKKKCYENPSFDDIKNALKYAKTHFGNDYQYVKNEINNIFNVEPYDFSHIKNIKFIDYENNEHPIAIILLAIKWLFVSEDIAYWNWSGRNMFMDSLREEELV